MSAMIVAAVVGAAVVGKMAADASKDASKRQAASAKTQLEFEQAKYNRWLDIYGDVEENLGEYYENLSPETYAAQGLQSQQQEYQAAVTQMKEHFAQADISGGAVAGLESQAALENARARATVRAEAPTKVAEAQRGFVSGQVAPTSGISTTLGQQTALAGQSQLAKSQQYQQLSNTLAGIAGTQIAKRVNTPPATPKVVGPVTSAPTQTLT